MGDEKKSFLGHFLIQYTKLQQWTKFWPAFLTFGFVAWSNTSVTTHTSNVSIINQKFVRLAYQHQPPPPSAPFLPSPPSLMACSRHPAKSRTCRLLSINCYPLYGGGMPGRWTSLLSHIVGSRKGTYPHARRDCFCLQLFNHVLCQVRAHVSPV